MNILKAFLLTLLWMAGTWIISIWTFLIPDDSEYYLTLFTGSHLIIRIMTLVVMVLVFKYFKQQDALRFDRANPTYYVAAVFLGIGFLFFQSVLLMFYYQDFTTEYFKWGFRLDRVREFPLLILSTVLLAPIVEELFFRNFILRGLLKRYGASISILVSSLLFSMVHLPFDALIYDFADLSFRQAYTTFFGGALAGLLYYKSKSIIPPILLHMFWNLTAVFF